MVDSLQNALEVFLSYISQLIGAIIILIVGYTVAKILQAVFSRVLEATGFDGWMELSAHAHLETGEAFAYR